MLASLRKITRGTSPTTAVPGSWLLTKDRLPCDWLLTMVRSTRKPKTTQGVFQTWKTPWSVLPNACTKPKWTNAVVPCRLTQELPAYITARDRVFKWQVMPFGVANAPGLIQECVNKFLYILRRRPLVQEGQKWRPTSMT